MPMLPAHRRRPVGPLSRWAEGGRVRQAGDTELWVMIQEQLDSTFLLREANDLAKSPQWGVCQDSGRRVRSRT
jgi:hypothetical protein